MTNETLINMTTDYPNDVCGKRKSMPSKLITRPWLCISSFNISSVVTAAVFYVYADFRRNRIHRVLQKNKK